MAEYLMPQNRGERGRRSPFTLQQLRDYAMGERHRLAAAPFVDREQVLQVALLETIADLMAEVAELRERGA